jgi:hypothetical protein
MKNKETLEETNKKSFGEIWSTLTDEQSEYLKGFIDRQRENAKKWQQERMYSEEEVLELLHKRMTYTLGDDYQETTTLKWFEQFKKK